MHRILVAQCEQEISSFNPVESDYALFDVHAGAALLDANRGADTCVRGALDVLAARADVTVVPVYGASAPSAGPLSRAGFERIASELLGALERAADGADGLYFAMHGAMGAIGELDPEGHLLEAARRILGPRVPIVLSLDLHGIVTERMLRHCDAAAVYHTYPHQDFVDTGERAARLLLDILDGKTRPVMARVRIPALVRGPELMTATGLYGEIIDKAKAMERRPGVLAAAVLIGNPFTDVPELCTQSLVVTDGDAELAGTLARELAEDMWAGRARMQATLTPLDAAIEETMRLGGPVTFTDAADAPSSGASGDGNAILAGLLGAGYRGSVLMPVVDAPAVEAAHAAGVGARIRVPIGGSLDPARFPPLTLDVEVAMLGNGRYRHEVSRLPADAGRTAVLVADNVTIIAISRTVFMMDRAVYLAHGRDPSTFDVTVVKSPGAYARWFTYAARNYVVDVPGSTTANLVRLGHRVCARPMYPLETDVSFTPRVEHYPAVAPA